MSRVVVVGASVAGVRTAQSLRREGFDGNVVVIGAESDPPYDKPPLSKAMLLGTTTLDRIALLSLDDAAALGVELRLGVAAEHVDVAERAVHLADGSGISYDQLVLATGTRARPSPWGSHPRLHLLRTLADCYRLSEHLQTAQSLVVVGGGFIGAEVAATASARGVAAVTVVDPLPVPMARVVGSEVGAILASVHEKHGVATLFGVGVEAVVERGDQLVAQLTDGTEVAGDAIVVGIGAVPNTEWLEPSGLPIDNGVMCDEWCRVVGRSDVWAAGDLARWFHPRYGVLRRVEHWTHAGEQAACVAQNIAHPDDLHVYDPVDYVWSDQYDWKIQIVGHAGEGCTAEVFGDPGSGQFAALYADDAGRFAGAVTVSWPKAMLASRKLLVAGGDIVAARAAIEALTQPAKGA